MYIRSFKYFVSLDSFESLIQADAYTSGVRNFSLDSFESLIQADAYTSGVRNHLFFCTTLSGVGKNFLF